MCASRLNSVGFSDVPNPLNLQVKPAFGAECSAPDGTGDVRNLRGLWWMSRQKSTTVLNSGRKSRTRRLNPFQLPVMVAAFLLWLPYGMGMSIETPPPPSSSPLRRWLGLAVVVLLMGLAYSFGLHNYLSLQSLAENRESLRGFTANNLPLALLIFVGLYAAAVSLSIPGATILTVTGGFLFGWLIGGSAAVLAATLGATTVFQIARSSFGEALARKAGPSLSKLKDGFAADAFNYLLFLRLVPAFPFWLVNIASALTTVSVPTFASATALGIIPGTFAFAFVGEGLDSIIAAQASAHAMCVAEEGLENCSFDLSLSSLVTTELLLAFAALGVVSLLPVAFKKWKRLT